MKKLNLTALCSLKSTFATLNYKGDVKTVVKARIANEHLTAKLAEIKATPAEKGAAPFFTTLQKSSSYTVSIGVALEYARKAQNAVERNGSTEKHEIEKRDLGMFPVYGELVWVKNDLSKVYLRMYQVSKPKDTKYIADGGEISAYKVAQWLPSDDYKRLSGEYVAPAQAHNEDGDLIFAKDENGENILDVSGQPVTIALPPLRAVSVENCTLFVKGKKINIFTDADESDVILRAMRDEYRKRLGLDPYEEK